MDVKAIRQKLGLTQEAFSLTYQININTLRQWERGARVPDGPAQVLLRVISSEPDAVRRALEAA